jgi:hypothetical protein
MNNCRGTAVMEACFVSSARRVVGVVGPGYPEGVYYLNGTINNHVGPKFYFYIPGEFDIT